MSAPALEVDSLEKTFQQFRRAHPALRGVSLKLPRGAAFGLIGPNGAGKTTFIKLLLGIARPSGGRVRVLGGDPEDAAVRRRIGYLPERLALPAALDARAYLRSVARLKGVAVSPEALLERVGLRAYARQRIGTYSKGMRQRLGLAGALVGAPELLVLDEPTDGVDPMGRRDIRTLLAEERARGATLFLNSHLLSETERVCDRVGILVGGRLVKEGALEALRAVPNRWEARFETSDAARPALVSAGFEESAGGAWHLSGDASRLNAALDQARTAGALLVSLSRPANDLEALLSESMGTTE